MMTESELYAMVETAANRHELSGADLAKALEELKSLRDAHEAMRPVIRQLEQFATQELALEAAPETCKAAQVVVEAWRAAEGEPRIESALANLGSEHVEPPDWQQGVWDQILDEKPSRK
jgi:hypothetical protein